MRKHILILLLLFAMPVLVHSVTEEGITITKISMEPVSFNERRDPVADSPFNAFDGDVKSAALYSDFTMEFARPVTIDQIRIINGNAADKDLFKKSNRERDIEITLYTVEVKSEKKIPEKKIKKKVLKKTENKKTSVKDQETKDKSEPDKVKDKKADKDKIEKIEKEKQPEKIIEDKNKEIKKTDTPEKVVNDYEFEKSDEYLSDVKFILTADEKIVEPEKKAVEEVKAKKDKTDSDTVTKKTEKKENRTDKKTEKKTEKKKKDKKKSDIKKTEKKKFEKKDVKKEPADKKTAEKKPSIKTVAKKGESEKSVSNKEKTKKNPAKEKAPNKNIIEITDSKKDVKTQPEKEESVKNVKTETVKTENKEEHAVEDKPAKIEPDKPLEKIVLPEIKKIEKKKTDTKDQKKDQKKDHKKKTEKKKKEKAVKSNSKKEKNKNKIEITDSKNKKETADKSADKTVEKTADKTTDKAADKSTDKKSDKENKKGKTEKIISDKKKKEKDAVKIDNKNRKPAADKTLIEDTSVKKMAGVVKIENDSLGRVLIYTTLKDTVDPQTLDLKGKYAVTKIDFRTRDDGYYTGSEPDRSGITEISFVNNKKIIPINGIDTMKKNYSDKFSKKLTESISGETFLMYENGDVSLRMTFRKDGVMEFNDRFKCSKKGDADCTSLMMPDRWKITDGKLYMRYHTLWRNWKYELDSQSDMLGESSDESDPPRWLKLYFKSDAGFTDKYLDLVRSEKGVWAE